MVGYGVRHTQRKYESGVQEVQARSEHTPTPFEGILNNIISRFPLCTSNIWSRKTISKFVE
jgi:hypothetical protein